MSQRTSLKIVAAVLAAVSASACATPLSDRPVYNDIGIRLSGQLGGKVSLSEGCFAVVADGEPVFLIFPNGTKFEATGFVLPVENGGIPVSVGDEVKVLGGYLSLDGEGDEDFQKTSCRGSAFLVNSMERLDVK